MRRGRRISAPRPYLLSRRVNSLRRCKCGGGASYIVYITGALFLSVYTYVSDDDDDDEREGVGIVQLDERRDFDVCVYFI